MCPMRRRIHVSYEEEEEDTCVQYLYEPSSCPRTASSLLTCRPTLRNAGYPWRRPCATKPPPLPTPSLRPSHTLPPPPPPTPTHSGNGLIPMMLHPHSSLF